MGEQVEPPAADSLIVLLVGLRYDNEKAEEKE